MKNNINKIIVLFFSLIFFSCISYKDQLFKGEGHIEQARVNAIIDFANTYKTPKEYLKRRNGKPFNVFWVYEQRTATNEMYLLGITPENQGRVSLSVEDSIGKISKSYFPNRYRIENGKLFIWKDDVTPLNKEILDVINGYGVLDSMDIKIEMGLYPIDKEMLSVAKDFSGSLDELITLMRKYDDIISDDRVLIIDDGLKGVDYYICKHNVGKYKKVFTNIAFGYYTPPKLKCGTK